MKAKEYLSQAYRLDNRINSKIDQVASLNDLATKCTSNVTGMPKAPNQGSSTMADAVVKIIDLQAEINRDIDRLVDLKRELTRTIKAVDDVDCQLLLEGATSATSPGSRSQWRWAFGSAMSTRYTARL